MAQTIGNYQLHTGPQKSIWADKLFLSVMRAVGPPRARRARSGGECERGRQRPSRWGGQGGHPRKILEIERSKMQFGAFSD